MSEPTKRFEDLTDEELEAVDREIAKTPEGRALLRRVALPTLPQIRIYARHPLLPT
jgi:hypothetical protein